MKILGLLSRKGGSGKSTLALHMAVVAQATGQRVLLIDLDPQKSAAEWWQARAADTPELDIAEPRQLEGVISAARTAGVDLCIIDTRPSAEADAIQVASLADHVLIPTRPAILDLRAILGTMDIVKGGRHRASIVLNACPAPRGGAGEASATNDARKALKSFGVPVAPVAIVQRTALAQALTSGLGVSETEPNSKAAKEIRALWRYVEKELNR